MWHICMLGRGNILNVSSETEQIHKVKSLTPKDEKTGPTSCICITHRHLRYRIRDYERTTWMKYNDSYRLSKHIRYR